MGLTAAALLSLMPQATLAQSAADISADHTFSTGFKFAEQSGESLYKSVCQACHMPNGEGAIGAGSYPSLANDPALGNYGYPVYVVVFGKRAMPSFGDMMSNDQVAAVVSTCAPISAIATWIRLLPKKLGHATLKRTAVNGEALVDNRRCQ